MTVALIQPLTPREVQVADLLIEGLRNYEIARKLGITEQTVKEHVKHLMQKTNLWTRTKLAVAFARQKERERTVDDADTLP